MNKTGERELANSLMTVFEALEEVSGRNYRPFEGTSPKLQCPYDGLYHDNPRTMRIYPHTNSAWCFACSQYMTPVSLIGSFKELSLDDTVQWIKEWAGYKEPDPEELWDAMMAETEPAPDRDHLAEALKTACSRMCPDWKDRQFDPQVSHKLSQCLSLLPRVRTESDSKEWLQASKLAMDQTLRASQDLTPS